MRAVVVWILAASCFISILAGYALVKLVIDVVEGLAS